MHPGKSLVIAGLTVCLVGLIWLLLDKFSLSWRIPGDVVIKKEGYSFYFPLGTCLLISLIASLLLWLFRR